MKERTYDLFLEACDQCQVVDVRSRDILQEKGQLCGWTHHGLIQVERSLFSSV